MSGDRKGKSGITKTYGVSKWESGRGRYGETTYTKDAEKVFDRIKKAAVGTEITLIRETSESSSSWLGPYTRRKGDEYEEGTFRVTGTPHGKELVEKLSDEDIADGYEPRRISLSRRTSSGEVGDLIARDGYDPVRKVRIRRTALTQTERDAERVERIRERRQYKFKF